MTLVKINSHTGSDICWRCLLRYLLRQRRHRPGFLRSGDLGWLPSAALSRCPTQTDNGDTPALPIPAFDFTKGLTEDTAPLPSSPLWPTQSSPVTMETCWTFFHYLVDNEGVSSGLFLQSIGTGMEAFTANNINFLLVSYLYHTYQLD
jgi:hypothetical protein